ncbi:hypothetical protein KY334_07055 [Candidatus Woesearchaeota archaeon]|nr:hypothetical protein [Candidatus Woesearchaeota archaeon]
MKILTQQDIEHLRKNPDSWDWYALSRNYKLSEDFIREFKNKVDWYRICKYQKLSENFIREFRDKLSWFGVLRYKKISEDFFLEFKDKLFNQYYFQICCCYKNYNNIKLYLKHGIKLDNHSRKNLFL